VSDGKVLQELKGHRARVKAFSTSVVSHGVDVQLLASASSDGEVKAWTMMKDGTITENGSYDTGNRLLCLAIHDAAIEQLDSFSALLKKDQNSDNSSGESEEESEEEDEWNGIDDA